MKILKWLCYYDKERGLAFFGGFISFSYRSKGYGGLQRERHMNGWCLCTKRRVYYFGEVCMWKEPDYIDMVENTSDRKSKRKGIFKPMLLTCLGVLIGLSILLPVMYTHTKTVTITYGSNPNEFAAISLGTAGLSHCKMTQIYNTQINRSTNANFLGAGTISLTTIQYKVSDCFDAGSKIKSALDKAGVPSTSYNIKVRFFSENY